MLLIVTGGRDRVLTPAGFAMLDALHRTVNVTLLVSGHAQGVDQHAEKWALYRGIPVRIFPADWTRWGKAAGPIRNGEMARFASQNLPAGCAVFPGNSGTNDMYAKALRYGLKIWDWRGDRACTTL